MRAAQTARHEDFVSLRWRRHIGKDWLYELILDGQVRATIERHDPPNNSHFSIWTIHGRKGQFATLRDAKYVAEANLNVATPMEQIVQVGGGHPGEWTQPTPPIIRQLLNGITDAGIIAFSGARKGITTHEDCNSWRNALADILEAVERGGKP